MSLPQTINTFLSRVTGYELAKAPTTDLTKAKPKSMIETGGKQKQSFGDEKKRDRETLKKYKTMYEQGGGVSTGLDLYPMFILANGYRLEGDTNGEIQAWLDSINFNSILWQGISDAVVYGDGFQENVGTRGGGGVGGDIITLAPRSPIDFDIEYDDKGVIKNYVQVQDENTGAGIKLKPEQITHLVLLPQSGSLYGLSIMKRAYDDVIRDTKVTDASSTAMYRHGFKKYHVKVGTEGEIIDSDVLSAVSKKFEDVETKNEFVTPHDIEILNIDEGGLEKVEEYNQISLMRLCTAIGVPAELIGLREGTTDNTAVSRIKAFFKKIQTFQGFIAQCYNVNVIDRKTGRPGEVKLVFADPDPSDEKDIAQWIAQIMTSSGEDPFAVLPLEWIQQKFSIMPSSIKDVKSTPKATPTAKPKKPKPAVS